MKYLQMGALAWALALLALPTAILAESQTDRSSPNSSQYADQQATQTQSHDEDTALAVYWGGNRSGLSVDVNSGYGGYYPYGSSYYYTSPYYYGDGDYYYSYPSSSYYYGGYPYRYSSGSYYYPYRSGYYGGWGRGGGMYYRGGGGHGGHHGGGGHRGGGHR